MKPPTLMFPSILPASFFRACNRSPLLPSVAAVSTVLTASSLRITSVIRRNRPSCKNDRIFRGRSVFLRSFTRHPFQPLTHNPFNMLLIVMRRSSDYSKIFRVIQNYFNLNWIICQSTGKGAKGRISLSRYGLKGSIQVKFLWLTFYR